MLAPRTAYLILAATLSLTACTAPVSAPSPTPSSAPTAPPSSTPAPSPQPSPTVTATPEPTVPAPELLQQAIAEGENGNYEAAGAGFAALVDSAAGAEIRREALWRLGQAQLQAGAYQAAAASLQRFIASYPGAAQAPAACYWLGQALAGAGAGAPAADAYRSYLQRRPLLSSFVQQRIGDALAQAGDHQGAANAYRSAADAEQAISTKAAILESLATSLRALQRCDEAVAAYDEILQLAKIAAYRAQIMYEAGAALQEAGRTAEAAARWNELVATYPETAYAAQALPQLDAGNLAQADAVTRARVDYGAGRYDAALATLQRFIRAGAPDPAGRAHYYAALCYRGLGQHKQSLAELDALIAGHPQSALLPEASYQVGESLALLGAVDDAAAAFQRLAERYPQQPRAIQALWRAAQVYDSSGRSWDASAAYARAAATYPGASYAADARFAAGFTHYLMGAVQTAAKTWAALLPQEQDPAMRARLLLWQGKVAQRLGDAAGARDRWAAAAAADPQGFWGYRAGDLLAGRRFAGQAPAGAFDPALYRPRGSQAEAEAWLIGWAGAPPAGQSLADLPPSLAASASFQRGAELWALGEAAAATAQLRQVQAAAYDDPRALYALALYGRDRGLYLLSATSAGRILELAPAGAAQGPPRFIEELAYPTYYADLVLPEAGQTDTDPLLFFALVHQESVFDRAATSRSDARGLAQVIPSTGAYIAGQLGDSSYAPEKLWRPAVSIRYGLWYLSAALRMFGDDALMALVAYNAGPGNAAKWGQEAGGDEDVFFEQVASQQPRAYMQRIYEHRAHYEQLYR